MNISSVIQPVQIQPQPQRTLLNLNTMGANVGGTPRYIQVSDKSFKSKAAPTIHFVRL